jgi:hypothetical protein
MKYDGAVAFVRQYRHAAGMSTVQQTMTAAEKQANDILAGK